MAIYGNMVGSSGGMLGKTVEIISDDGVDLMGVVVDQETVLTAVASKDIREGTTAVTNEGLVIGSKRIPAYETTQGFRLIDPGAAFTIEQLEYDKYNYTQLQCMIAPLNTSVSDSCAVDKIAINNAVFNTGSANKIADVTKNLETKSIDLNITNTSSNTYIIYFFTYKEEED